MQTSDIIRQGPLFRKNGEPFNFQECTLLGLLYSAHWCPPCNGFLPHLLEFSMGASQFEIIYVPLDASKE